MGLINTLYKINIKGRRDGERFQAELNVSKGFLASWEDVLEKIKTEEGLSDAIITKIENLEK